MPDFSANVGGNLSLAAKLISHNLTMTSRIIPYETGLSTHAGRICMENTIPIPQDLFRGRGNVAFRS